MSISVAQPSKTVEALRTACAPITDIIKGGRNMRSKGETYLPKFPMEADADYKARQANTWLFNGVKKARDDMTGRVFAKPVTLADDLKESDLAAWMANVDMEGRDLSNFAKDVFEAGIESGLAFIMADAPQREGQMTAGQATASGLRPFLVGLTIYDVLGWKWDLHNNAPRLTQFRISEQAPKPGRDEYSDETVEQVRVLNLIEGKVQVTLHRQNEDGKWVADDPYPTDMDKIMVAPFYTGRTGFFTATPPLDDIAELNLAHWRVQSDKSNCLHKSLSPMLLMKMMSITGEDGNPVVASSGYAFQADSPDADMRWVEIAGSGLAAGTEELNEIKDQMQQMGLQLINERVGVTTATGDSINDGKSVTRLRMWADDLKDALEIALGFMVDLGGLSVTPEVVVNKDIQTLDGLSMAEVKDMYTSGAISRETYINEAKRRGVLDEAVTAIDEQERIEGEGLDGER